jgi:hypothetical protein
VFDAVADAGRVGGFLVVLAVADRCGVDVARGGAEGEGEGEGGFCSFRMALIVSLNVAVLCDRPGIVVDRWVFLNSLWASTVF